MTAIVKLTDRFAEAGIDEEIVVMRLDTGEFFELSESSAAIWRLIDGKRDKEAVISALARGFAGKRADIVADVDEILMQLREMGLLADA